jgi:glycosyltransferase involved in cell wall biosynthesis
VLLNGMDLAPFATARRRIAEPGRAPVLVHIGRAAPEKNRAFLLRVHAEARRSRPDTTLRFVGPGGTADLDAADVDYAADPHIEVLGETDHVEQVLTDCDVLLLPSLREGMPGVALQALASGLPVLGASLSGLRAISVHAPGITVLPLEAGPREWARVALRLAELPQSTRDEISDGMLRSPFAINAYAASWMALWTE